jgi:hypothetical protein
MNKMSFPTKPEIIERVKEIAEKMFLKMFRNGFSVVSIHLAMRGKFDHVRRYKSRSG